MPPSNLTGFAQDSTTILLSWEAPMGRHNGIIREYRLNITEIETGQVFSNISASTSLVISNLHPDYTYEWTVTAFTVIEGPYSYLSRVTTLEDGKNSSASISYSLRFCPAVPRGPPTSLNGTSVNSSSIFLNWGLPLSGERNGDIIGYAINVTNLDNETVHQFMTGTVSNFTVTDLYPFTLYESRVFACTAIGIGPSPAIAIIETDEDGKQTVPTVLVFFIIYTHFL